MITVINEVEQDLANVKSWEKLSSDISKIFQKYLKIENLQITQAISPIYRIDISKLGNRVGNIAKYTDYYPNPPICQLWISLYDFPEESAQLIGQDLSNLFDINDVTVTLHSSRSFRYGC